MESDKSDELSNSELEAITDQVAERLDERSAASRASGVPRRGVLAALGLGGLATLGTGTASAQSVGQIGTSTDSIDVFGYDVEAENSFTDPAGVEHTGELADLSDTGGAFSIEDSGTTVLSDASGINFDSEIDASDDGDGSITASVAAEVVSDGDGTDREIWVIANGASDPAGAGPDDIIFEEEA